MLDVQYPDDCGNAPKKQVILDFNRALAAGDVDGALAFFATDAVWERVGEKTLNGHDEIRTALQEMATRQARRLEMRQIITHGRDASARGLLEFQKSRVLFAHFYAFKSAGSGIIKRMQSFAYPEEL